MFGGGTGGIRGIGDIVGIQDIVNIRPWALEYRIGLLLLYTVCNAYSSFILDRARSNAIKHTLRRFSSTVKD